MNQTLKQINQQEQTWLQPKWLYELYANINYKQHTRKFTNLRPLKRETSISGFSWTDGHHGLDYVQSFLYQTNLFLFGIWIMYNHMIIVLTYKHVYIKVK